VVCFDRNEWNLSGSSAESGEREEEMERVKACPGGGKERVGTVYEAGRAIDQNLSAEGKADWNSGDLHRSWNNGYQ
jgi:hypothetical protein